MTEIHSSVVRVAVPARAVISNDGTIAKSVISQGVRGPAGVAGDKGDKGDTGLQGPPGAGSADFVYHQLAPATVWTIVHNLGRAAPPVFTVDSGGTEMIGDISYPDTNTAVVTFAFASGGIAYVTA